MRTWRVGRTPRSELGLDERHLARDGSLKSRDLLAIRRLAARLNDEAGTAGQSAHAGEIVALDLLHEVAHVLIERYERDVNPEIFRSALAAADEAIGKRGVNSVLRRLTTEFGPEPDREEGLESLLLLALAGENPAVEPIRPLADPRPVAASKRYADLVSTVDRRLGTEDGFGPGGESLVELLRAPARHAPSSLAGQLRYVRSRWANLLPTDLIERLVAGEGLLAEEERALHLRFGGGGGGKGPTAAPSFSGGETEAERFSEDRDWMPRLVLLAKSTYVWLDQLSRRYGREIRTLDAIPDEELDTIAARGISGLWLIGLWQRSRASGRIKRMRGNPDAVASAYSLDDYRIADDLGGEAALGVLREQAAARGIRLASDMVPNHMGLDSRWVVEHPERFIQVDQPPYPAYRFEGANLSDDPRVEIRIEDHYWDDSDAAVVFERRDAATGERQYLYHGNDGTSFPWNDTAQLDFLRAEVREVVIATILDVARRFPVIRFDAAMVLARKHVQRLWYPLPGQGGGIPSRSEHALSRSAFDKLMPTEFWRDVVDRVAAEAPDTLLLAEAFWLLEGYFVRTLGMHRVYNSAFMHMLRDEDNAGYRKVIRDTLEFDPEILKRYVNFLTNPDEETAIEQFGTGDKYFGAATLLATLPGLPMIGHGQVEGYGEKYGMEFQRARLDEQPNEGLVAHFEAQIVPLLRDRRRFAEAADFLLYDVVAQGGALAEDVFAYSNGQGPDRSLVIFHNRHASTAGWIRESVPFAVKGPDGSKTHHRRTLADGLQLGEDPRAFLRFRDWRSGQEYVRGVGELRERGLYVELGQYECLVLGDFEEVVDTHDAPWARVANRLAGHGTGSLDETMADVVLEPVHEAVTALLGATTPDEVADRRATLWRLAGLPAAAAPAEELAVAAVELEAEAEPVRERAEPGLPPRTDPLTAATRLAGIDAADVDRLRLVVPLRRAGLDAGEIERTRVALRLGRPSLVRDPGRIVEGWLADAGIRAFLGVHDWQGHEWLAKDRLTDLLALGAGLDRAAGAKRRSPLLGRIERAAAVAEYRVDRWRAGLHEAGAAEPAKATRAASPRPAAKPKPKPKSPSKPRSSARRPRA